MAFANSSFAEADPEPLTLANFTTKALTDSMRFMVFAVIPAQAGIQVLFEVVLDSRLRGSDGE
jgi:hypothetical protein